MISGWFSGQPVAKAVTKSAAVDRFVIGRHPFEIRVVLPATIDAGGALPPRMASLPRLSLSARHERGDLDFDFRTLIDQACDVKQCRGWEVSPERLAPGRADSGARGLVFPAAGQIPGEANNVLGAGPTLRQQL